MKPARLGLHRLRNSCDVCTLSKLKCSREKPVCQRCIDRGCQQDCNYSVARRPGRRRQQPIVSDDGRPYITNTSVDWTQLREGTTRPSPSLTPVDSLRPTEERHNSTRDPPQQTTSRDREDRHMNTISPQKASMKPFTEFPVELPHDGNMVDFEVIDDFSLWEWGVNGIDIDAPNRRQPGYMAPVWDIPLGQAIINSTEVGVCSGATELESEPSPPPSYISRQTLFQDDQVSPAPTLVPAKSSDPSISAASNTGAASSNPIFDLSKDVDCKCSYQISQLIYWVSLPRAVPTPLEVVFAVEQQLKWTKDTISLCANCSLSSPYMSMVFCTSMSWLIEHLEEYIRGGNTVGSHSGQVTNLKVGGLTLSKERSHSCSEALVKLRLRRIVQTVRELAVFDIGMKSTLLKGIRLASSETGAVAQQMFGMLEMKGVS